MKHSTKQLISLLICLAMALALLPMAAFADGATYIVAGTGSLCGVDWQEANTQNRMTDTDGDGIYTITYTGIAAGTHKFKVTDGSWANAWGWGDDSDGNTVLTLDGSNNTVEIRFNSADQAIQVLVNGNAYQAAAPQDGGVYYVAGAFNGWNAKADGYQMTAAGNGTYTLELSLTKGDHELKVTDGTWTNSWGEGGGNLKFSVAEDNGAILVTFNFADGSVTVGTPGETLIAEDTAVFETDMEAWDNAYKATFTPAEDGQITVDITAADPGFGLEVYVADELIEEYMDTQAQQICFAVTAGNTYELYLFPNQVFSPMLATRAAGSVSFKITADVAAAAPEEGGSTDDAGATEENPKAITDSHNEYIEPGTTMWFVFDNTEHMMNDGSYSQMLHINSSVSYAVTFRERDIPVDENGFVSYEMVDISRLGKYVFSITNNGSVKALFVINVKDRPSYVLSETTLVLGDNTVTCDADYARTLYEFIPDATGVYTFTTSQGTLGNWGTTFNPVDTTADKTTTLEWTCTAVGQSVLVGVTGAETAVVNVAKTGEYVAANEPDWEFYTNTYNFNLHVKEDAQLVSIDVLDDVADAAVVGPDGFYRYGSAYGPLIVTDLTKHPVNLADAILNGQLRAYIYDEYGTLIQRIDYNEAMQEYLDAGLTPVTKELGLMLQQIGTHLDWWNANGFVFENEAPQDLDTAWLTFCSYITGTEPNPNDFTNSQGGSNNQGGNQSGNQGGNQGGNNQAPGGTQNGGNNSSLVTPNGNPSSDDISFIGAALAMTLAGCGLIFLKKKEEAIAE